MIVSAKLYKLWAELVRTEIRSEHVEKKLSCPNIKRNVIFAKVHTAQDYNCCHMLATHIIVGRLANVCI